MKYKLIVIAFALAVAALPALSHGAEAPKEQTTASKDTDQDELALFRASLRIDKRDFVKSAMNLNEEQGQKFWSVYHQYEADLMKLNDKRLANIKDYADNFQSLTEAKADELVKHAFEFRKARTALLEKYYSKIAKATSKAVGARFLQVENVLQGVTDVAVGASIPLMPKD
jgi:hypothetical protein